MMQTFVRPSRDLRNHYAEISEMLKDHDHVIITNPVSYTHLLYPHMTVYKNIAFGLELRKTPKDEIDKRVHEAAKILEIEHLLDRKPKALSGGQRQRVALGRARCV